ncbi:MAG: TolB family protein [Mangrovibacterium sp.]
MKELRFTVLMLIFLLAGCRGKNEVRQVDSYPPIVPDYTDISIPCNIAPLNFKITDSCDRAEAIVTGRNGRIKVNGKKKLTFPLKRFHQLLEKHQGDTLSVSVRVRKDKYWTRYKPFYWVVTAETVDPYLSYRLIEPGYEVYRKLSVRQRGLTNFKEKVLADNNLTDGACINCHITNKHQPGQSFFHIRHQHGGTIIARGNALRKIDTKTKQTLSAGVYGNWHPSGRFIVFSANVVIPAFHSVSNKRMEVYDTTSDLIVLDVEKNEVFSDPRIARRGKLESFPEFSADGRTLFFCVADSVLLPDQYRQLRYSLCSIGFDAENRTFTGKADTLFSAHAENKTVSMPRASPDGKYLMFTVFDYGTFPIWHNEAMLYLLNLKTGKISKMPVVNAEKYSNSYHSWSANSRWFVFASKRDNGMYGKPYFSYIRPDGQETKPFVLPQKDPEFYNYSYQSFNIPELSENCTAFDALDVEALFQQTKAEKVTFVETGRYN